jgi:hypothetical protein
MYPIMTSCVRRGTTNLGPVARLEKTHLSYHISNIKIGQSQPKLCQFYVVKNSHIFLALLQLYRYITIHCRVLKIRINTLKPS